MENQTKDKTFCVYMHINKINDKKYIGITCRKPEERWGVNGKGYIEKEQSAFAAAINKYTWDGFEHIIIAEELTETEAKNMEIELIAKHKTNCCRYDNPSYGYNMTDGGDGASGYRHTEDEKMKISQASKLCWNNEEYRNFQIQRLTGEGNPFYGKKHTEESKEKMSKSLIGKKLSEEARRKISKALTGIKRSEETRQKMSLAQKKLKEDPVIRQKLSNSLKGKMAGEKHPNYGKHRSDETKRKIAIGNGEPVLQFNVNGEFVTEYFSETEAERHTGIHQTNISACCRKLYRTAGGFFWIYKKDYNPEIEIWAQVKQEYVYKRSEKIAMLNDVPVVQLSKNMEFINEFISMAEAKRLTGILHISECCNGIRKTAGGYKWMKKSDWELLQLTIQN